MDNDKMLEYGVNKEQYEALDISKSIAVRAGAGSGKTRVLTSRYLRLLKEVPGIDIKNIVAITFTNKAALEMKERIRKAVSEEITNQADTLKKKRWKSIRDNITLANIDTIHGFCSQLIKENFYFLGVDPNFQVIKDVDMRSNIIRFADEAVYYFFSKVEYRSKVNALLKIYSSGVVIGNGLRDSIISSYNKIREKGMNINDAYKVTSLLNKIDFLDRLKIGYEKSVIEYLNIIEILMLDILKKLDADYTIFKAENNVLDFNDLEILTYKLLDDKSIRYKYKENYKFILLDESQDINVLEKSIIYKLAGDEEGNIEPGKLFIVGDHKQSIYGFRGTDYKIFGRICNDIGRNGEVKFLSNCYRSSSQIIKTVNSVFDMIIDPYEPLKVPEDREVEEGRKTELILINNPEEENCSKILWKRMKDLIGKDERNEELKDILLELENVEEPRARSDVQSEVIAERIKKLIEDGFHYRDIAILLRSRTNLASIENYLRKLDIPYSVLGGIGFWGRQEIIDIINLYRFIVDSSDIVALAGVLRSAIFSFDDSLLFKLMTQLRDRNGNGILECLQKLKDSVDDAVLAKVERAHRIMTKLKAAEGLYNTYELLNLICDVTCYRQILLTQINGFQKYRNIEKLMTIAKEFYEKNLYNAREFGAYLQFLEDYSSKEEEALLDTEDSNAVKVLTIHSSKGLEFRAVIIPDMSSEVDWMTKRDKPLFIFSEKYGITAIYYSDKEERSIDGNPLYKLYYDKELEQELEDSKRVFYVAATRAQEFLAFIGEDQLYIDKKGNIKLNTFMRQLKYAIDLNGGSIDSLVIKIE